MLPNPKLPCHSSIKRSIDWMVRPFIENAGVTAYQEGFANPQLQSGGIRTIYFGLKVLF